jgi:hypothetical protein
VLAGASTYAIWSTSLLVSSYHHTPFATRSAPVNPAEVEQTAAELYAHLQHGVDGGKLERRLMHRDNFVRVALCWPLQRLPAQAATHVCRPHEICHPSRSKVVRSLSGMHFVASSSRTRQCAGLLTRRLPFASCWRQQAAPFWHAAAAAAPPAAQASGRLHVEPPARKDDLPVNSRRITSRHPLHAMPGCSESTLHPVSAITAWSMHSRYCNPEKQSCHGVVVRLRT